MRRRDFIKGCIFGAVAISLPIRSRPERFSSFKLGITDVRGLRVGDYVEIMTRPVFRVEDVMGGTLTISADKKKYVYLGNHEFAEIAA